MAINRNILYPLSGSMVLTMGMIIQVITYALILPDSVPIHFSSNGADSYGTKWELLGPYIGVYVGLSLFFIFLIAVIPTCTSCQFVNIPNKEYWFDPAHPERTKYALRIVSIWFAWFLCTMQCFLFAIFELLFEIARNDTDAIFFVFYIFLGCFFIALIVQIVVLCMKMSIPENEAEKFAM